MSQQFLHHFEFCPHTPKERRIRVSKRVPPEALFNAQFVGPRQNEFSQNRLTPERLSTAVAFACENPIVRFAVMLLFFPFQKCFDQERMNRNWLLRRFGFAWTNNSADNRPRYVDQPIGEVDVAPL